jgi:hypothetical protein
MGVSEALRARVRGEYLEMPGLRVLCVSRTEPTHVPLMERLPVHLQRRQTIAVDSGSLHPHEPRLS